MSLKLIKIDQQQNHSNQPLQKIIIIPERTSSTTSRLQQQQNQHQQQQQQQNPNCDYDYLIKFMALGIFFLDVSVLFSYICCCFLFWIK